MQEYGECPYARFKTGSKIDALLPGPRREIELALRRAKEVLE